MFYLCEIPVLIVCCEKEIVPIVTKKKIFRDLSLFYCPHEHQRSLENVSNLGVLNLETIYHDLSQFALSTTTMLRKITPLHYFYWREGSIQAGVN